MRLKIFALTGAAALVLTACTTKEEQAQDGTTNTSTGGVVREEAKAETETPPVTPMPAATVIQSQPGPDGSQVDLLSVKVTGDILTVTLRCSSPERYNRETIRVAQVSVIDDATSQRIGVLKDNEGNAQLGLGATYRFQTKMKLQEKLDIVDQNGTSLYSKDQDPSFFTLPAEYGAGLTLTNGTITWVADYRHQLWNSLNEKGATYSYQDGERYSTGIEYTLKRQYYNQTFEGAVLQAGFAYNKSPLVVSSTQIKDISGSIGMSLPSKNGQLRYYIGLEAGQRGQTGTALVKETYVNAIFNFSLRDIWFFKRLSQ